MASILSTIMRIESGGRNIPQNIDDINMRRGTPAQGYFQIISPTWSQFGGDKTEYKSAIDAPYTTQLQVAQNIPVSHWGPATQQALKAAGYEPQPGETLGQMLARYKEDPTATRPEDVGGSGDGGRTAVADKGSGPDLSGVYAGLLAQQQEQQAATARAAALAEEAKQQAGMQSAIKQGAGLLAAGETPAPPMALQPLPIHRPQMQQQAGGPDFTQMLAQQRLMRRV